MITEIITEETVKKYMPLLKNEEIFGIENERFTCFGACDEETGDPIGILTAEVYMEHIRIRRIFTSPKDKKTEKALISLVTDLPEDMKLPVYCFGTDEEIDEALLLESGFTEVPSDYSYIEGTPEDIKDLGTPPKVCEVRTLDRAPLTGVQNFITETQPDGILGVPDSYLDLNRFSDASLVAVNQHRIVGLLMVEETDDMIEVPYICATGNKVTIFLFYVFKKLLEAEYDAEARLRFVICDELKKVAINALMESGVEKKVRIFRYD